MSAILAQCTRRDLLFFAVLLHDVGKWKRDDHIARGIEMTEELSERLGLDQEERSMLRFLVEHHQDMVLISRRRNLDDYEMVAEFAGLFANAEWLRALYLVSYADLSAVAPDAWTDWQGALLWELYYKTAEQLHSDREALEAKQRARQKLDEHLDHIEGHWPAQRVVQFQEHLNQLPPSYLVAYNRAQIRVHLEMIARLSREQPFVLEFIEHEGHTEVVVCTRDQRQLIAKICGALAVNDINILRADVNTRADDVVLDIFQVTNIDGSPALPDWKKERMRERVAEVISLRLKARELIAKYSSSWDRRRRQRQYDQAAAHCVRQSHFSPLHGRRYRSPRHCGPAVQNRVPAGRIGSRHPPRHYQHSGGAGARFLLHRRCRGAEDHQPRGTRPDTAVPARRAGVLNL